MIFFFSFSLLRLLSLPVSTEYLPCAKYLGCWARSRCQSASCAEYMCTRHVLGILTHYIIRAALQLCELGLLLTPVYRWHSWGPEKFINSLQVIKLIHGLLGSKPRQICLFKPILLILVVCPREPTVGGSFQQVTQWLNDKVMWAVMSISLESSGIQRLDA